jgi:hypothetical protein
MLVVLLSRVGTGQSGPKRVEKVIVRTENVRRLKKSSGKEHKGERNFRT